MRTIFATILCLTSISAFAFKDGDYHCESADKKFVRDIRIKTVDVGGEKLPFVEVKQSHLLDDPARTVNYTAKGLASVHTSTDSSVDATETLGLSALNIQLTDGAPRCAN